MNCPYCIAIDISKLTKVRAPHGSACDLDRAYELLALAPVNHPH